jgi:hypothetical protein
MIIDYLDVAANMTRPIEFLGGGAADHRVSFHIKSGFNLLPFRAAA